MKTVTARSCEEQAVRLMQTLLQGAHGYDATQHRTSTQTPSTPTTVIPMARKKANFMTVTQ